MPLSDIRTRFILASGRKDFETSTVSADRFINAGMRYLDSRLNTQKSLLRYQKDIAVGDFTLNLKYCRAIKEVWVMNADGRTIVEKRTLKWIRENYADLYADLDTGTPLYYAPAVIGLSPEHTAGTNLVTNGGFDDATIWTPANGWTISGGIATHSPTIAASLYQDTGVDNTGDVDYWVTFTVKNCVAGTITPYLQGTAGTARSVNGSYTEVITHDGATANDLIVKFTPSTDFDGAIDDVSVSPFASMNSTWDWQDLLVGDHWSHRGIIFMPPADEAYTMTVFARFFSKPLEDDTDENYWTEEQSEILVHAACYELEVFYRNMEGAKGWLAPIELALQGIDHDTVEEQLVEMANQARGYS